MKVLHVVEALDRGAVENWLVHMLRHAHRSDVVVDWTFYCILDREGVLEEAARGFDARVVRSPVSLGRPVDFIRALRAELKRGGYDVLHCHHDLVSALYLTASTGLPLHRRIVHVHNADQTLPTPSVWKQRVYRPLLRRTCLALADRIVGISNHTLDTFLAGRARRPGRDLVHYYGVDPAPFGAPPPDRAAFRRQLGMPEDALILLFAGRVVPEKNPVFAVDVVAALRRAGLRAVAVFAGAGSQEPAVLARAKELGVAYAVHMLGWSNDLPHIMRCADWFILPRPERPPEGFGLAVVEAQLAGLRLLLSRGILDDPLLPTAVFRRLPLADPPRVWAEAAIDMLEGPPPSQEQALAAFRASPMDMDRALGLFTQLYGKGATSQ
jgi:glycosyltransferase involved in cell wall biosynthesis